MRIERLTRQGLDAFLQFNKEIDPTRQDFPERFECQVLTNPLLTDQATLPVLIAVDDAGRIVGQHLHQPCQYYFRGQQYNAYFGFDFYVLKELRGRGIGSTLAREANQQFYPHFGLGVAEVSQRILLALGNRIIGHLFLYLWIRNWLSPVKFAIHQLMGRTPLTPIATMRCHSFPKRITIDQFQFKLVQSLDEWPYPYWEEDRLEFSRSLEFLRWRFFMQQDRYCFYIIDEPQASAYIMVRKIVAKGLSLLAVVDYRVGQNDPLRGNALIKLAKRLASIGRCDGILTMSSHQFFDNILKRNRFWRVGRPIVIMTNASIELDPTRVNQRTDVLATMADADLDFYFPI